MLIMGVHGINTPPDSDYAMDWQVALASAGLKANVAPARWGSSGQIGTDIRKTIFNFRWRNEQIDGLKEMLHDFHRGVMKSKVKSVVVAHSLGQPLILAAERRLREEGRGTTLNYVSMGGPLCHPIWGSGLRAIGMGKPTAQTPVAFWNYDDGVCSTRLGWTDQPQWMDTRRIAVGGDLNWFQEHPAELYLSNPNVADAIKCSAHTQTA